jgi:hypothetical protein
MNFLDLFLKYAALLALVGAAVSFGFGFLKWIDQRKREQEQKEHDSFHRMVVLAAGRTEDGKTISMNQQIAAIYQLALYKRYAFASVPVLELMKEEFNLRAINDSDPRSPHMCKALNQAIESLSVKE